MPDTTALTEFAPAFGPSVHAALVRPVASVTDVVGVTLPPPAPTTHATATEATGLLLASSTWTTRSLGSSVLTGPVWLSPETIDTPEAAPGVAVAVNVTGEPARPSTVAKVCCGPAVPPSVRS